MILQNKKLLNALHVRKINERNLGKRCVKKERNNNFFYILFPSSKSTTTQHHQQYNHGLRSHSFVLRFSYTYKQRFENVLLLLKSTVKSKQKNYGNDLVLLNKNNKSKEITKKVLFMVFLLSYHYARTYITFILYFFCGA
jgi:hypothetical protein